ncbi:hypothetical protein CDD83_3209 [Cordyceps sp. RAO-2017]|nr:hypothetical protein CDD83_3209 [Cordyceps sp. RAO-2017]
MLRLYPEVGDRHEVFDLLQQTMNIPNLTRALSSDPFQDLEMHNIAVSGTPKRYSRSNAVYAVPGRNTLALMLAEVASSRQTTVGIKYWNLMVRHYGVVPDNDNWERLLTLLRAGKASANAAAILEILPADYVDSKPYRVAMETCLRDNINHQAFRNANKVLGVMMSRLPVPDLHVLRLYLRVALVSHFQFRAQARRGDEAGAKRAYGLQITKALSSLWEPYKKAHHHWFKDTPSAGIASEGPVLYNNKREVVALARLMFSALNKVVNEGMLPDEELRALRSVGAKINREIQAFYANRQEVEPNLSYNSDERRIHSESSRGESVDPIANPQQAEYKRKAAFIWDTTKSVRLPPPGQRKRQLGVAMLPNIPVPA